MNRQAAQSDLEITVSICSARANRPWCATLTAPPATSRLEFSTHRALLAHLEWLISGQPGLR
jgi:hypothetical protein